MVNTLHATAVIICADKHSEYAITNSTLKLSESMESQCHPHYTHCAGAIAAAVVVSKIWKETNIAEVNERDRVEIETLRQNPRFRQINAAINWTWSIGGGRVELLCRGLFLASRGLPRTLMSSLDVLRISVLNKGDFSNQQTWRTPLGLTMLWLQRVSRFVQHNS